MKTLYISLIWLMIILLTWFYIFTMIIDSAIKYLYSELDTLYYNTIKENYSEARINADKITERWEEVESKWIYFVNQTEVDNIKASIAKINNYIKIENQSMILFEIEETRKFLRLVRGNESLNLENLF